MDTTKSKFNLKTTMKAFLDYLVKTMNGMAFGLFSTLIIGVIISQIGTFTNYDFVLFNQTINIGQVLIHLGAVAKGLMGVGIALGIAWSLDLKGLKLISSAIVGGIATSSFFTRTADPAVTYVVVVLTITLVNLILKKKTPVDILLVPLLTLSIGIVVTLLVFTPVNSITVFVASVIGTATEVVPFLMGIIVSALMGIALTAPISSAAIAISIFILTPETMNSIPIAAGASVVGCATQMIGFAIQGRKSNSIGVTLSVAFGTSMLQFKNILRKPIIWLPTIIASAILGPFATVVFQMKATAIGAGMGTSGLVGVFGAFDAMGWNLDSLWRIGLMLIVLPSVLVLGLDILFKKFHLYKDEDLKI